MRNAISAYFQVFWNKLDVLAIALFIVGFTLRFIPATECFCAARIVLSVDLTIWFMRSLDIFAAVKRLGPKLVMIGEMVIARSMLSPSALFHRSRWILSGARLEVLHAHVNRLHLGVRSVVLQPYLRCAEVHVAFTARDHQSGLLANLR